MLKVRDDEMEWTQVIRSNDLFRGVPYNLVQFTAPGELYRVVGIDCGCISVQRQLHVIEPDMDDVRSSNADSMAFRAATVSLLDDSIASVEEVEHELAC